MKEAVLIGMLAMGTNVDDNKIEIQQLVKPVTINVDGKQLSFDRIEYIYSITEEDTKAEVIPHITRHVKS